MKKALILIIPILILSYTGFQTIQTQIARFQLKEYSENSRRGMDILECSLNDNGCKIEYGCSGKCFKYRNFIDDICIKYLNIQYGNEILFLLSGVWIFLLWKKGSKKSTILLEEKKIVG